MNKPKETPKYILPSQRVLNMITEIQEAGKPLNVSDVSTLISLQILDKLEEVVLTLRAFLPQEKDV